MFETENLIGKVVTIKLNSGIELMATLNAYNKKSKIVNLNNPNTVVIMEDQIAVVPFIYTGHTDEIIISLDHILAIVESTEKSAKDYLRLQEGE
jgi:small nuclear ribonucleoprotein (snRNP)-like protein